MGAVAGYSIVAGHQLNLAIYEKILVGLFISPIAGMFGGYSIYKTLRKTRINRIKSVAERERFEEKFFIPGIVALILLSIGLGANSIGIVVGILGDFFNTTLLGVLGAGGIVIGILTWSYKIARTVGISITDLSPTRGFSSHLAAGLIVISFVLLSIPVSVTQILIGTTMGVAIARGRIELKTTKNIALSWLVGLPLSFVFAAVLGWLL